MRRVKQQFLMAAAITATIGTSISLQRAKADTVPSTASASEAEGIIFERQEIMTQLDKDSAVLGKVLAGIEPRSKLAVTTHSIAQGAKDSLAAFQSKLPGGRSKPEVWSHYDDFMNRMQTFAECSEDGRARPSR